MDIRREAAVVQWNQRALVIDLPDLGPDFEISGLNAGNDCQAAAQDKRLVVSPGSYLLTRSGVATDWDGEDRWNNVRLGDFHSRDAPLD